MINGARCFLYPAAGAVFIVMLCYNTLMSLWETVIIGAGLAMDALAVSICKGLAMKRMNLRSALVIAAWFGGFQALMPLLGSVLGIAFRGEVESFDHWIAFVLLALIGANMIRESLSGEQEKVSDDISFKVMLPLAVATSIDALTVGITFALLGTNIVLSALLIGAITFVICFFGVFLGTRFGEKLGSRAELAGGIALILIGLKILLEHLGVL